MNKNRNKSSRSKRNSDYSILEPRNLLAVVSTFQDGHLSITLFAEGDQAIIDVVNGFVAINDQLTINDQTVSASEVNMLSVKGAASQTNQRVIFRGEFSEINSAVLDSLFAVDVTSVTFSGNYHVASHAVVLLSRIESGGEISDRVIDGPRGRLHVEGFTWLNAGEGSISLKNQQNDFGGQVFLWSKGATNHVTINDANDLLLAQATIGGDLILQTGGNLSNVPNAAISIGGNAQFVADAVELGTTPSDSFFAQSVSFSTNGQFRIGQNNDVLITGDNSAGTAWITTLGSIRTAVDTTFSTDGFATFFGGTGIELGQTSNNLMNFGFLTVNSPQQVIVNHNGPLKFAGNSTVNSMNLSASGLINNSPLAKLKVIGDLSLDAPEIRLGEHSEDFFQAGRVNFQANSHVALHQNGNLKIWGENIAGTFLATSQGFVTTDNETVLDVKGFAAFFGQSGIQLGTGENNSIRSGGLTLNSPQAAVVNLEGAVRFVGNSSVNQLTLTTTGDVGNAAQANLTVLNDASFNGTELVLGGHFNDSITLGRTNFIVANDVLIHQDNRIVLFANNQATNAKLVTSFNILDAPKSNTAISNLFSVKGALINLGTRDDETLTFGQLTFNSTENTNIRVNGTISLIGESFAGNRLILDAEGDIVDLSTSAVKVVNRVDLTAENIILGGALDRCFEIMGEDPTARLTLNTPLGGAQNVSLGNC